jgi:hypothetical protein
MTKILAIFIILLGFIGVLWPVIAGDMTDAMVIAAQLGPIILQDENSVTVNAGGLTVTLPTGIEITFPQGTTVTIPVARVPVNPAVRVPIKRFK